MLKAFVLAFGASFVLLTASAHAGITDFAGPYKPENWTFTSNPALGDGSVDTAAAPFSITITGSNSGIATSFTGNVNTDFTIAAAASGLVSFDWSYSSADSLAYDRFGYLLNGSFTQLTQNDGQPTGFTGFTQFNVLQGDVFGFRVFSEDNIFGPGIATISNFAAPNNFTAVPEPGSFALVGSALVGVGLRRFRRVRV